MTVGQDEVSLDEINRLLETLSNAGLKTRDIQRILESSDPGTKLTESLNGEVLFPRQWTTKYYEFKQDHPDYKWIKRIQLPEDGLTCKVCDDCGSHVWVKVAGYELHLSRRIADFVQITPSLQVKPTTSGLLVRRPRTLRGMRYCQYAAD